MSYILDALRKSEQERQLVRMLRTVGGSGRLWAPARRRAWPVTIGLAVVLTAATIGLRFWWAEETPPVTTNSEPAARPVAVAAIGKRAAQTRRAEPAQSKEDLSLPPAKSAVQDLASQARVAREPKRKVASKAPAAGPAPNPVAANIDQVTASPQDPATIPFLRQMPDQFRSKLPELVLNVHLYSANESENLVYINNRQYRRGEQLEGGIRLEQIVPEGVVLSYAGTYFKLPRPN